MTRSIRWLSAAALLLLATAAGLRADEPASSDAARAAYASAAALQNREAWDLAAEEWQALVKAHPNDPLALKGRYYLAVCQLKNDQWPAAEKTLREVVASKADAETVALARWELARGTFQATQAKPSPEAFKASAGLLREFLTTSPKHPQAAEATHLLGESLWQAGSRDEAIAAWQGFVRDHADSPRMPEVLYALGVGLAETGKKPEAAAAFDRFAKSFATHKLADDVALWRADVASAAGQPAEAEKILAPVAAGKGPRVVDALERLGDARWKQKNWPGAAEAFGKLAAEHASAPQATRAAVSAGRALVEAGKLDEARPLFTKAVAANGPESLDAAHRLALLELAAKRPAQALDVATKASAAAAGRTDAEKTLVAALALDRADALWEIPEKKSDAAAAFIAVADGFADTPAAAPAAAMAAIALLDQGKAADALARADTFLSKHASKAAAESVLDVRAIRAEALLALGKHADAANAYRELAAANPQAARRPSWLLREGTALAADKQWQKAHDVLAPATATLTGDQQAEALFLDATALVELKQAAPAAKLLATIDTAHPKWPRRDESLLLATRALRETGDKPAALAAAERLMKEFPEGKNADVGWYRLGQSRQDAGKFDEAIDAFAKARAAKPQGSRAPWALLATGWCHESQKRLPEAIKAWSELISAHPDSAAASSALLARGDARYRTGDFAGGGADAERILDLVAKGSAKLDPAATGEARLLQGLCLSSEKKYAQAAAAFQKLLQEQPNFPAADRALFELGLAQTLGDKPADATPTFETLVKRFPKSSQAADAWLEIGEARWKAENWPAAAEAYRAAIAAVEKNPAAAALVEQARHKLGWTHHMRKEHAPAAESFAAQVKEAPAGPLAADGQAMLGESLLALGKPAEAAKAFAAALSDPKKLSSPELRATAFVRAAEAAARAEKWADSLAIAEQFLAAEPGSPQAAEVRYAAGWARQNLGKLDDALADYRAVADGPRTVLAARARLMEGEVLFEQEKHKDAIKSFFKVAYGFGEQQAPPDYHPWQAQATYEAARCFEVLGKADQARKLYAELVDRYPQSQQTPAARKRLESLGAAAKPAPEGASS